MRTLLLLPSLTSSLGGIQTHNQSLVRALLDLNSGAAGEVLVLALNDPPGAEVPAFLADGALKTRGFGRSKLKFAAAALQSAPGRDLILVGHIHFSALALLLYRLAPGASLRQLIYGVEVWRPLSWITGLSLRQVKCLWSISDFSWRRMLAFNPGLQGLRAEVLPCTLGPDYAGRIPAMPARATQPQILCVSRLAASEPYKNVELLIRAMLDVLTCLPEATLVIVGPGDDRPRLEAVSASLGLGEHVRFMGRVSEDTLQSYFAGSDLFVLPSTGEGFGIVFLEAMHYGKACIGARAAAVPEVIEDGVTGLLIDPETPGELSAAIVRLLEDDALRNRMGQQGRRRLEEEFSMTAFRTRLAALLRA